MIEKEFRPSSALLFETHRGPNAFHHKHYNDDSNDNGNSLWSRWGIELGQKPSEVLLERLFRFPIEDPKLAGSGPPRLKITSQRTEEFCNRQSIVTFFGGWQCPSSIQSEKSINFVPGIRSLTKTQLRRGESRSSFALCSQMAWHMNTVIKDKCGSISCHTEYGRLIVTQVWVAATNLSHDMERGLHIKSTLVGRTAS